MDHDLVDVVVWDILLEVIVGLATEEFADCRSDGGGSGFPKLAMNDYGVGLLNMRLHEFPDPFGLTQGENLYVGWHCRPVGRLGVMESDI